MTCSQSARIITRHVQGEKSRIVLRMRLAAFIHAHVCGCATCQKTQHIFFNGKPRPVKMTPVKVDFIRRLRIA